MTDQTTAFAATESKLLPIITAAVLGLCVVFVVGLAQASTLHDSAHDVRHANGLPCH